MTSTSPAAEKPAKPRDRYWRSLSELHESPEFNHFVDREFPIAASELPEGFSRRRWLQLMGASLSMAGVVGCRYPTETIAPFVIRPEGRIPGEQYGRSTNFEWANRVYNLLITNVDGRPIKVEGNAAHPTGGGTDAFIQASILGLYDPDRSRGDDGPVLKRGKDRPSLLQWSDADASLSGLVKTAATNGGQSFALLVSPTQSPTTVRLIKALRDKLPQATVCRFDSVSGGVMRDATKQAIGSAGKQVLDLDQAKVILSFQSDFLTSDTAANRNAKRFAATRDPEGEMSRLYAVEGNYTNTGASADTRYACRPSQMLALMTAIEKRVDELIAAGGPIAVPDDETPFDELEAQPKLDRFIAVVAQDLKDAGDRAVVVVGETPRCGCGGRRHPIERQAWIIRQDSAICTAGR